MKATSLLIMTIQDTIKDALSFHIMEWKNHVNVPVINRETFGFIYFQFKDTKMDEKSD